MSNPAIKVSSFSGLNPNTAIFVPGQSKSQSQFNKKTQNKAEERIKDVWADNFEQEIRAISQLIETYNYIAMDTEFPGVVARPVGDFKDFQYQTVRVNVDLLKIIQLGVSFSNSKGELPKDICTWQFNFKFNIDEDMYAEDSIDLLKQSGIDFQKHREKGIEVKDFAEMFIGSGLVLNEEVTWISFHSGYDYGYLIKILQGENLPDNEESFYELLHLYFPQCYDIKYMLRNIDYLKGGLNKVADELKVERIGPAHQAGSDSLVTLQTYIQIRDTLFKGQVNQEDNGILFGLGLGAVGDQVFYSAQRFGGKAGGKPGN